MNKILLTGLATAALFGTVSANAADMAVKAAPIVKPSCAQFGGAYIGVQGGSVTLDRTWTDRDNWADRFAVDIGLDSVTRRTWSGAGGFLAGYNVQRGCTVFGLEGDWSWTGLNHSRTYTGNGVPLNMAVVLSDKLDWYGTVRARAGVVVDDLLIYATGGLAFANAQNSWSLSQAGVVLEAYSTGNDVQWGWTAGFGTEFAWTRNWSVKSEILYVGLAEKTTTVFSPAAGVPVSFDTTHSLWVSRIGLNYRF
jgi:outer membrane immunogenic protein